MPSSHELPLRETQRCLSSFQIQNSKGAENTCRQHNLLQYKAAFLTKKKKIPNKIAYLFTWKEKKKLSYGLEKVWAFLKQ